eukprot:scaffold649_cov88-Isochrysis_galbana.AAC.1
MQWLGTVVARPLSSAATRPSTAAIRCTVKTTPVKATFGPPTAAVRPAVYISTEPALCRAVRAAG